MVEKEILKHLFTDKSSFRMVQDKNLKSSVFIEEADSEINRFRLLYEIAVDYYRTYNDVLSRDSMQRVLQASKASNDSSAKLLSAYDEVSLTSTSAPLPFLIDTAKKDFKRAKLRTSLTQAADMYRRNAIEDVAPFLQKEFYDITHDIDELSSEATISESVEDRRNAYANVNRDPGVLCGFPSFDQATNGLYPGQILIVAAGTSEGKSVMLLNMAHNAWLNGKNVLFITIENYRTDLMRRFDALNAMVPYNALKNGTLADDERTRLDAALEAQRAHKNIFYVIDKPTECTPEFIEAKINDLQPLKFDLLVVDYLLIMQLSSKQKMERDQYYGNLAAELRRVGRVKGIPVVTAVQINREGIKEKGNSYGVQHIALSQFISNHADIIMSMRAIDQAQAMASGVVDLECSLIKHRDGPKVRFSVKANFERMKLQEQVIQAEEMAVVVAPDAGVPTQETLI